MLFQGDLRQGWWLQLVCHVDVLLISPPCPAWSLANIAHDLSRDDGFLTIEILLKATVLQPSAIVLENVSKFMAHAHYPIVLDVLDWLGWKVEWGCKANLSDVLPQSRERSLLTLVRKLADLKPEFAFRPWQKAQQVTLHTCDILRPKECLARKYAPDLSTETLRLYFAFQLHSRGKKCDAKSAKLFPEGTSRNRWLASLPIMALRTLWIKQH